jgi:hypothetical protein
MSPRFQGEAFYDNLKIVDELDRLAKEKNLETSQLALAWVVGLSPYVRSSLSLCLFHGSFYRVFVQRIELMTRLSLFQVLQTLSESSRIPKLDKLLSPTKI